MSQVSGKEDISFFKEFLQLYKELNHDPNFLLNG